MKQDFILEFKNITKNYGKINIIKNLNLNISHNEVIGLLGVNGAGKTTTIKMMLGQEIPTTGKIKLFGKNPTNPESRIHIGSTPQNIEFPEGLKTLEIIQFVQAHYPNPLPIQEMVEKFGLTNFLELKASKLSGGQKRRLALALAFIGNPKIVFLDEPTTGLDVEARKILWEVIKDYKNKGKTIFLTTHYLEEIEQIATRILFLQKGEIIADESVEGLQKLANSTQSKVSFDCGTECSFEGFQTIDSVINKNRNYTLITKNSDALIYELVKHNIPFSNLQIKKENLESAFLNLSKGE
ncbi:ABC transporter ATP-binding protein [Fluviispira multicolorata]|uniref:ATP-binding cassette domain-containing protein n=1 Tax=Fluviispira multicolorata TaxID=2654512 RepID=A0A833N568_9BACT|nr:ABC transporter ATP-binding protein [Fluviispira multicolorata]KAB8032243.1 ATP-binding cassette domain-containing protein [Fluviispira multicolorata]